MKTGIREAEYAAFMATIIKLESDYEKLKKLLEELNLWDAELKELDVNPQTWSTGYQKSPHFSGD